MTTRYNTYVPLDVKTAIWESNTRHEVVRLPYSEVRHKALASLASNWVEGNEAFEYWSEDVVTGRMAWRVHLTMPVE